MTALPPPGRAGWDVRAPERVRPRGERCHAVGVGALLSTGAPFSPLPEVAVGDFLETTVLGAAVSGISRWQYDFGCRPGTGDSVRSWARSPSVISVGTSTHASDRVVGVLGPVSRGLTSIPRSTAAGGAPECERWRCRPRAPRQAAARTAGWDREAGSPVLPRVPARVEQFVEIESTASCPLPGLERSRGGNAAVRIPAEAARTGTRLRARPGAARRARRP